MLISSAYAQEDGVAGTITADDVLNYQDVEVATPMEAVMWNVGIIIFMVFLFYLLMIRPQQKRFKEHAEMISALKKGDKVTVAGSLIGTIAKIKEGENEVSVEIADGVKVTALRSSLVAKDKASAPLKDLPEEKKKK